MVCLVEHLFIDVLAVGLLLLMVWCDTLVVFIRLRDRSLSLISVATITIHFVIDIIRCLIDLPSMLLLLLVLLLLTCFALLLGQLGGSLSEVVLDPCQLTGHMRVLPDAFNEDDSLVSGLPLGVFGRVVVADVAQLVHLSHDRSLREDVHLTVFQDVHFLVFNQLIVIEMIVVDVGFSAQISDLALLDLNEDVFAIEVKRLVSPLCESLARLTISRVHLVQDDFVTVSVNLLLHGRELVLLKPVYQVSPAVQMTNHPLGHQRNSLSDFDDPVNDDFHPLEVAHLAAYHLVEESTQEGAKELAIELGSFLGCLDTVLKQDQEWSDLVEIVLLETLSECLIDALGELFIIVSVVNVCFGKGHSSSRFVSSCKQLDRKLNVGSPEHIVVLA